MFKNDNDVHHLISHLVCHRYMDLSYKIISGSRIFCTLSPYNPIICNLPTKTEKNLYMPLLEDESKSPIKFTQIILQSNFCPSFYLPHFIEEQYFFYLKNIHSFCTWWTVHFLIPRLLFISIFFYFFFTSSSCSFIHLQSSVPSGRHDVQHIFIVQRKRISIPWKLQPYFFIKSFPFAFSSHI